MDAIKVLLDNTGSHTYCTPMTYPALHTARAAAGGSYNDLARLLGVTASAISQWKNQERVPLKRALQIEALTAGQVTKEELRPDVFLDPAMCVSEAAATSPSNFFHSPGLASMAGRV